MVRAYPELELGAGGGLLSRGDGSAVVDYGPSVRWSVHGSLRVRRWLGIRLTGGMEYLSASVPRGSLGVEGDAASDPSLMGPHVVLELQPVWQLNQSLDLFSLVGVGWQRFETEAFAVREPTPLLVNERTGVVVELPVSLGGRLALGRSGFGVSLTAALAIPLMQTGALFDSDAGAAQSVRQDTGLLTRVDAFQHFGPAYGGTLAFDLQL